MADAPGRIPAAAIPAHLEATRDGLARCAGLPMAVTVTRVHIAGELGTVAPRYVTAADLAGLGPPVLTVEQAELLARGARDVDAAVRERGR